MLTPIRCPPCALSLSISPRPHATHPRLRLRLRQREGGGRGDPCGTRCWHVHTRRPLGDQQAVEHVPCQGTRGGCAAAKPGGSAARVPRPLLDPLPHPSQVSMGGPIVVTYRLPRTALVPRTRSSQSLSQARYYAVVGLTPPAPPFSSSLIRSPLLAQVRGPLHPVPPGMAPRPHRRRTGHDPRRRPGARNVGGYGARPRGRARAQHRRL